MQPDAFERLTRRMGAATTRRGLLRVFAGGVAAAAAGALLPREATPPQAVAATATPSATVRSAASASPTPTVKPTETPTPTEKPTETATAKPAEPATPTPTQRATAAPSETPAATPTPAATARPEAVPTACESDSDCSNGEVCVPLGPGGGVCGQKPAPTPGSCREDSDCPNGGVCLGAVVSNSGSCCPSGQACYETCCPAGQGCATTIGSEGCCPSAQLCNGQCCAAGDTCTNGECTPPNPCGAAGCGAGEQCLQANSNLSSYVCCLPKQVNSYENVCCDGVVFPVPCGANCCTTGSICCDGSCCAAGTVCIGGTCYPSGTTTCGSGLCLSGATCCNGACCAPSSACCGGKCCSGTCCGNDCCESGTTCAISSTSAIDCLNGQSSECHVYVCCDNALLNTTNWQSDMYSPPQAVGVCCDDPNNPCASGNSCGPTSTLFSGCPSPPQPPRAGCGSGCSSGSTCIALHPSWSAWNDTQGCCPNGEILSSDGINGGCDYDGCCTACTVVLEGCLAGGYNCTSTFGKCVAECSSTYGVICTSGN